MVASPVGILALQGDFAEHAASLHARGVATRLVRRRADLDGVRGMVLPGGESTTMLRLLGIEGLEEPLARTLRAVPVLATCAGLILLARAVVDPRQRSFGLLDATVQRNGYGRQLHSGTFPLEGPAVPPGATGVFIRAPRILDVGDGVEVLARRGDDPVLVRQGAILGTCFHPELEPAHFATALFLEQLP
jgi:5'-phosphate synthase pdxT subunit